MSKNGIIGVNGDLPWSLPEDRKIFMGLTRNRILIIGRRTFEEHPQLAHINHTRYCIVVSRTLQHIKPDAVHAPNTQLLSATSLSEAIRLAGETWKDVAPDAEANMDAKGLFCWVAGGESIYREALSQSSASELHLSVVDVDIDASKYYPQQVARFPSLELWREYAYRRKS
eukprot:CAMPEP_0176005378 /NCGR_PEP_ID=MMETSP0120_2-20121206/2174_1 /TAXON_ID=160619 /ORGANISM="Kryptoperidinium foliaceum, Strain CCMP 1326" /LENGTH=170 /DNA_ID=CAMNT_0017338081 /DNA_START=410 /DNA_END=922 /DNA_ORIENTATION=-